MRIKPRFWSQTPQRPQNTKTILGKGTVEMVRPDPANATRLPGGQLAYYGVSVLVFALAAAAIATISLSRIGALPAGLSALPVWLAPPMRTADLPQSAFTTLPADWRDRDTAQRDHLTTWCKRADTQDCPVGPDAVRAALQDPAFLAHFAQERSARIKALPKTGPSPRDLRGANLAFSEMTGANLHGARLDSATLTGSTLEEATLTGAGLDGTALSQANLIAARLSPAEGTMARLDLRRSDLRGAALTSDPDRGEAIEGDFRGARMDLATLGGTLRGRFGNASEQFFSMRNADLSGARLDTALIWLPYESDALHGVRLGAAGRQYSDLLNGPTSPQLLAQIVNDLPTAAFAGSALAGLDLRSAAPITGKPELDRLLYAKALRNSFGDAQVRLPDGVDRPCHWLTRPGDTLINDDAAFLGAWRAWRQRGGDPSWPPAGLLAPGETWAALQSVDPRDDLLPPAALCTWDSCDCAAVEDWRTGQPGQGG
ncbi:pentapeptide repeat-containing protein [Tropicibacter sp. S64]|uniref:pentapeptide repeat-containing protein n=1 Tax=Tropicibacter sp. S64 TaxID=3415122 RepID=UPI003C7D219E